MIAQRFGLWHEGKNTVAKVMYK